MAMMCKSVKADELDNYKNGKWVGEFKYDGSRVVYEYGKFWTTDRMSFGKSRDVTYKFPELAHTKINAKLDGEIVAETGRFEDTGSRIHLQDKVFIRISAKKNPVIYHIFDIIEVNGEDVTHLPLLDRKQLLKSIKFDNERFQLVEWTENIQQLWDKVVKEKKEGIVLKSKDGGYVNRRSFDWLKCKNFKEDIVLVERYEEMPNNKGITLYMDNNQRLACLGGQSVDVRSAIEEQGQIRVEIQYLTKDNKANGKEGEMVYRFPSFKRVI